MMKRISCFLPALAIAGLMASFGLKQAQAAFSVPGWVDETIYQGNGMISMRFDSAGRLWVCEKIGRILVFAPNGSGGFNAPTVFADLSAQVNTNAERGMMGLAIDPDFTTNRYIYVDFATSTDARVVRLTSNSTFTAMVPGSELILVSGLPNANGIHKGGDIHFAPNDPSNLYVMVGDDGERSLVSNVDNYYGKILKINKANGQGLTTNPYYTGSLTAIRARVWSARYRNPYRFTFDPGMPINDVLYISENGDGTDRIARIEKGADGGWDNAFTSNSADGKRKILQTSGPSKTGIVIVRSGPLSVGGAPTVYHAMYGPKQVRRWTLTGATLDTLTAVPADGGASFYSGYGYEIVSLTAGPDGALYYTQSGQGPSTGTTQRLGRLRNTNSAAPIANFNYAPTTGQAPLAVNFTDTSTAPGGTIASRLWEFGDGTTSTTTNPSKTFSQPGVYSVSLTVTNTQGVANTKIVSITVYHQTSVTLSGQIRDGRSLSASNLGVATELRFYQKDGATPLAVTGGSGANGNILTVPTGGVISASFSAQITGNGIVVSAGESTADGVQPAYVGIPLSTTSSSQSATANFYLSDTMLRGKATDTLGAPAQVDIGLSRVTAGAYYAIAGGRDFLGGSGIPASGQAHRVVADALGYYHMPIRTGGGGATFHLDTAADTLASSHGKVKTTATVAAGAAVVKDITVGLYNGGTGEANLSGIAVTPNVDFASQIQSIFSASCAACHNEIATNSFGLDLQSGAAYAELVDQESGQAAGVKLVDPGHADRSYLMEKINALEPQVGTNMRPGDPMPLAQQALIRDWINQLTPSNPNDPPTITSGTTKVGTVGAALTYQIAATNSPTSYNATGLPPGLTVSTATGLISGTPTAAGTTTSVISATNANGSDTENLVFTISGGNPPAINSALTKTGIVGTALTYQITATNSPTSFGASSLPPGLSVSTTTGAITGTPTASGNTNSTITATNAGGTDSETLAFSILPAGLTNVAQGKSATASSSEGANVATNGNDGSGTSRWAASSGTFPQSWRVDLGSLHTLYQADIAWYNSASRSYKYRIEISNNDVDYNTVVDKTGNTAMGPTSDSLGPVTAQYVRVTVTGSSAGFASFFELSLYGQPASGSPPSITSSTTATATVGTAFSYQITATNSPTSYNATGLPAGLSVNTSTGLISGTPTTATGSPFTVNLTATNGSGPGTATLTLTINAGGDTNQALSQPATASSFQAGNVVANGNDASLTSRWAAVDGTFPAWWRVDLGAPKVLSRVDIMWLNPTTRAYKYKIETSTDDVNYTMVFDNTGNTTVGNTSNNITATARYVRIWVTGSTTGGFASFYDCKVFGH
jgi:PKD repeat protein